MRKHRSIRLKPGRSTPRFFEDGARLSRRQAIRQAIELLACSTGSLEAMRLIELFQLDPEELSEAGLPYETLKLLEKRLSFL